MTQKTTRNASFERRGANREPMVVRGSPGCTFLKPCFAITAQAGGLTVNVSARPEKDGTPRA